MYATSLAEVTHHLEYRGCLVTDYTLCDHTGGDFESMCFTFRKRNRNI